ncbi:MAG: hypothetical protein ACRCSN_07190 [Dermatophilaceae bacterium]
MTHAPAPVRFATDDDLVARVRAAADTAAASELWVRYHPFGVHAAHVVRGRSDDAEFVAAEAFTALLASLGHGAAVDDPFSLLLARRVSRAAAAPADVVAHDDILDDPAAFDDPQAPGREPRADALEQSVLREAFAALPDDSRAVIWHEVAERPDLDLGTPLAATRRAVARVRDDLRAMYVATLVSRDAVVPACRPYLTELPALVAGREASSETIVHAAGCHRCSSRLERLRELEYALPSAVLPLLAPLTSGSTLPLLGALPVVDRAQLDIVPHASSVRPLPPHQAARWLVGTGLAASVLVAATAIWSHPPTGESSVSARSGSSASSSHRDTVGPVTPPSTGGPGTGIRPPSTPSAPPGVAPPTDPPTSEPDEPAGPGPDDAPGTGGSSGPDTGSSPSAPGGSSPDPSGPTQTPSQPGSSTPPASPSALAAPSVGVAVSTPTEEGKAMAAVRADVSERASEIEMTIDPPPKVKAAKAAVASDLECKNRGSGKVVCTGAPAADGSITANVQLDWPEGVTGTVTVTVRVLEGAGEGMSGSGSGSPDPIGPKIDGTARTPPTPTAPPNTDPTSSRDQVARPGDEGPPPGGAGEDRAQPGVPRILADLRDVVENDLTPAEVRAWAEALLAELLAEAVLDSH